MDRRNFLLLSSLGAGSAALLSGSKALADANGAAASKGDIGKAGVTDLTMRFAKPARSSDEAIPLGNGLMGALLRGDIEREVIHLNESTLWSGSPRSYANKDAFAHLAEMRRLIFNGQEERAAELAKKAMGDPDKIATFLPFCDLHMDFHSAPRFDSYTRSLDLRTAISALAATSAAGEFNEAAEHYREAFVSYPDKVFCQRLSGSTRTGQTVKLSLSTVHPGSEMRLTDDGDLLLVGQLQPQIVPEGSWIGPSSGPGLKFAALLRVVAKGGTIQRSNAEIFVKGADEVFVMVSLATSFQHYDDISADPASRVAAIINRASQHDYQQLKARHLRDYAGAFGDVELVLNANGTKAADTGSKAHMAHATDDPKLYAFMFQLGRYFLLASSRDGGQPPNLQGIWNERLWPWWGAKYTVNVNLQMNYWLAGVGALPSCLEPFLKLVEDVHKTGTETARLHYDCRGFVLHHNTDLWRAAAPVDGFWGLWPVGGAWLVLQAYDLAEFFPANQGYSARLYPILRDAVRFFLDFLVPIPAPHKFAGKLATNPSSSPENWYVKRDRTRAFMSFAPTMDIQILDELFSKFLSVAGRGRKDKGLRDKARAAQLRLPPIQINAGGEIQEWIEDFEPGEKKHRHISHLYALYPGTGISRKTPELFSAARRVMLNRGDDEDGGSTFKAYRAVQWSRLGDGNNALRLLRNQLADDTSPNLLRDEYDQFDARIAAPAAIAEMLLQSHNGELEFLPALPDAWTSGEVSGLRARSGIKVGLKWSGGNLNSAHLYSETNQIMRIRYKSLSRQISLESNKISQVRFDLS